jgi:hypothetical protein
MSDGVAAVILSSKPAEVLVAGIGSATDIPTIADRYYFHSFPATVRAAAIAYGMAGVKDIRSFSGSLHVNMHDPFNGFGPVNMVDLGILPRTRLIDGLLDDSLTGENGMFPTNLTGGLKGRGHPLGATGMIQVVENHRMIVEGRFRAGLSHSIGGPINNNVVILLERENSFRARHPQRFKPWGLPRLGRLKPPEASLPALLAKGPCEGTFVATTTRFDHRSALPQNSILLVSCPTPEGRFTFLFGVGGEHYGVISAMERGDRVSLEMGEAGIMVNRMPVKRFYQRTVHGLVELAGTGWKRLTRERRTPGS